jgi:hypothetical protein
MATRPHKEAKEDSAIHVHHTGHWRLTQEVATDDSEAIHGAPLLRLDTDLPLFNLHSQCETFSLGFHRDLDEAIAPTSTVAAVLQSVRADAPFTTVAHLRQILKLDTAQQLAHGGEQRSGYAQAQRKFMVRIAAPVQHMSQSGLLSSPYGLMAEQASLDSDWQRHIEAMSSQLFSEDDAEHKAFCAQSIEQDMYIGSISPNSEHSAAHVRLAALAAAKQEIASVVEEHGFRSMAAMNSHKYLPQLAMSARGTFAKRALQHGEVLWPPVGGLMTDVVHADEPEAETLFRGTPGLDETLCDVLIDSGAASLHALVWQDPEQHRRSMTGFGQRSLALNTLPLANCASAVSQATHFEGSQQCNANVYPVRVVVGITVRQRSRTSRVQPDDILLQVPLLFWFVWSPVAQGSELRGEKLTLLQETFGHDVETTIGFPELLRRQSVFQKKLASATARVLALLWARCELAHVRELQQFQEQEGLAVEQEEKDLVSMDHTAASRRHQQLLAARRRLKEQGHILKQRRVILEKETRDFQRATRRDQYVTLIALAERVVGSVQLFQLKDKIVSAAAVHENARRQIWHMRHNLGKQFMQDTKPNPLPLTGLQQRQMWRSIDVRLVHGEQVAVKNSAVAKAEELRTSTVAQAEAAADAERVDLAEARLRQQQTTRFGLERVEQDHRLRKMREQLARLTSAVVSSGLGPFLQTPMQHLPVLSPHPRHLLLWGPQPPDVHYHAFAARRWWTFFALTVLGLTPSDLLWLRRHLIFKSDPARRWYQEVHLPSKALPTRLAAPSATAPGAPPPPGELFTRPNPEMQHQVARLQAAAPGPGIAGPPSYVHALAATTPAWAVISDGVSSQLKLREHIFCKAAHPIPAFLGARPRAATDASTPEGSTRDGVATPHWLLRCKPLGPLPSRTQQQREMHANDKLMMSHDQELNLPPIPGHVRTMTKGVLLRGCQRSPTLHRVVALSAPALFEVVGTAAAPTADASDAESVDSQDTILDEGSEALSRDSDEAAAGGECGESIDAAVKLRAENRSLALRTAHREVLVDGVQSCNLLEHFYFAGSQGANADEHLFPAASDFCASRDEPMLVALARLTTTRRDEQLKCPSQGVLQWKDYPARCVGACDDRPAAPLRTVRDLNADEHILLTGIAKPGAAAARSAIINSSAGGHTGVLQRRETDAILACSRSVLTPTPLEAACAAALVADEALLRELLACKPQLCPATGTHPLMEHLQDVLEAEPGKAAAYLLPCLPPQLAVDEVYELPCDDDDSDACDDFPVALHVPSAAAERVCPSIEHVLEGTVTHKWGDLPVQCSEVVGSPAWQHWVAMRDQRDFASAPLSVRLPALLAGAQSVHLRDSIMSWCFRQQQLFPADVKRTAERFDGGEHRESVFVPRSDILLARRSGRAVTAFHDSSAAVFSSLRGLWSACSAFRPPPYAMEQDVVRRFSYTLSFLAGRARPRHLLEPSRYQVDNDLTKRWALATVQQLSAVSFHATDWVGRIFKPVYNAKLGKAVQEAEGRRQVRVQQRSARAASITAAASSVGTAELNVSDVCAATGGAQSVELALPTSAGTKRTATERGRAPSSPFGRSWLRASESAAATANTHPQSAAMPLPAPALHQSHVTTVSVFDSDDSDDSGLAAQRAQRQQLPPTPPATVTAAMHPAAVSRPASSATLPAYLLPQYEEVADDAYLPPDHDM